MTERKIEQVLNLIGVPANIAGFEYIKDAVMILDRDKGVVKWTSLYFEIGKKRGKTIWQIERGIRYALEAARNCKAKYEDISHYIGFANLGNANSISLLYKTIKAETEDGEIDTPVVTEERVKEIVKETIREMLGVRA